MIERIKENLIARLSIEEMGHLSRSEEENKALASNSNFNKKKDKSDNQNRHPKRPESCHKCHKPGHWARECRSKTPAPDSTTKTVGEGLMCQALVSMQLSSPVVRTWYID